MSSSERSPKRRRTSYSPASPPLLDGKVFLEGHSLHTPPPSVHMSPSWQSQSLPTTNNSTTMPTPPSTSSFPSQLTRSADGAETMVETPERMMEKGDAEMEDADHRRTDHERIEDLPAAPLLYCVSEETVGVLQPAPSQDLLEAYSLKAMQASVARRDAKTGEKINKLRKSYETKSRNLGIEGRNKASTQEGHLRGLVDPAWDDLIPEDITLWRQKMDGVKFSSTGKDEIFSALDAALRFKPGQFPKAEHAEWTAQLGLDEGLLLRPQLAALPVSRSTNSLLLSKTSAAAAGRATAPASPNGIRPDRAGKKRRYDETSYEGYDDDGYSTGGMDDRRSNGSKRIKRKPSGI